MRLAWLGTYVQTQHDDRDDVVGQGVIDIVHDQDLTVTEARVGVDVGLTERLGASLVLPVRLVSSAIRYLDAGDDEVELAMPGIHHRNETLTGLADPMLLGSYGRMIGSFRIGARAGVTVPLGRTEENPFTAEAMLAAHQHVQMGTGTFNPVFAIDASRAWGKYRLGGFAFTQQVVYENGKGYQAGDRYAAGITLRRRLSNAWSVRGGAELQAETAEQWGGVVQTDDGNRGRIDAMFAAGASWSAMPRLTIDLALKIPVITHAVGGQLDMPAIVEVGAAWSFGNTATPRRKEAAEDEHGHGDEHDHGHDEHGHDEHGHDEHGPTDVADKPDTTPDAADKPDKPDTTPDRPDTASKPPDVTSKPPVVIKGDVRDHGKPGEALDLVPVPGKLTIFDFWATWCQPCKTLDPALVELAARYPHVAIRKVDVVDWDSKAAARYLTPKAFDLPHLKIYDGAGKLVLEKSSAAGKLQALIDEVRALAAKTAPKQTPAPAPQFRIEVTERGFEPANTTVPSGKPVKLIFERLTSRGCGTEAVFTIGGKRVEAKLPLNQPVELVLVFPRGVTKFACAMDMVRATITAK